MEIKRRNTKMKKNLIMYDKLELRIKLKINKFLTKEPSSKTKNIRTVIEILKTKRTNLYFSG